MMKFTILFFSLALFFTNTVFGGVSDIFEYDSNKIQDELSSLDIIDQFVEGSNLSYTEMLQSNNAIVSNLSYTESGAFGIQMMEPPLGIPSWVWGACGNIGGIALVYFLTEDTEETKMAAYGCVGGTVLVTGCWFAYVFLVIGASTL